MSGPCFSDELYAADTFLVGLISSARRRAIVTSSVESEGLQTLFHVSIVSLN